MKNKLPILAIETSGVNCSVALMLAEDVIFENNAFKKNIHSEKLLSMIDTVLKTAGVGLDQIGHIAISEGPGSFTGLRIGFSAAKGLALGADLPLVAVPTYEALAFHFCRLLKEGTGFSISSNLNTSEVYFAGFEKRGETYGLVSPLEVKKKSELNGEFRKYDYNFGDYLFAEPIINPVLPSGQIISKWSYFFGKDLLNFNFDYIEPKYLKNFIPKTAKGKK